MVGECPQLTVEPLVQDFVLMRRLYQLGFLQAANPMEALSVSKPALQEAIQAYQQFHHLEVNGWINEEFQSSLLAPRFCGLPDVMQIQSIEQVCKWRHEPVTWTTTGQLPGVPAATLQTSFALAWSYWSDVCGFRSEYAGENVHTANVLMGTGKIDGGMGILAWSQLPCQANPQQLQQLYSNQQNWVIAEGATQGAQIDLVRVAAHEIGHALGMPHIATGNLLAPIYSQVIRKPQPGDIAEVVRRYGPGTVPPPPPPPPPPIPTGEEIIVLFQQPLTRLILRRG